MLPDAGGMGAAAAHLGGAAPALRAALFGGLRCLAIGTGMHLLFETESGGSPGLGLIRGRIDKLVGHRTPHIGWNEVASIGAGAQALLTGVARAEFYFAHGAIAVAADHTDVRGQSEHDGKWFPAIVRRGGTWGLQFRPEKSGAAGLRVIRNFLESVSA